MVVPIELPIRNFLLKVYWNHLVQPINLTAHPVSATALSFLPLLTLSTKWLSTAKSGSWSWVLGGWMYSSHRFTSTESLGAEEVGSVEAGS